MQFGMQVLYVCQSTQCQIQEDSTHSPCFMPFCLNIPCQYTLLNLCPLIFHLMSSGWLGYIMLTLPILLFIMEILFLIYTHFFRNTTRV